jgi:hypothetical protein
MSKAGKRHLVMESPLMVNYLWFAFYIVALVLIAAVFVTAGTVMRWLGFGRGTDLRFREPFTRS